MLLWKGMMAHKRVILPHVFILAPDIGLREHEMFWNI
jgi:hypothetical protein